MKKILTTSISNSLQGKIAAYGDITEYLNKKADFADALGFVAEQMASGKDTEILRLIGGLLSEHQEIIEMFYEEAREIAGEGITVADT